MSMEKSISVYVLTMLSIDVNGDVQRKIAGVTFSLTDAEEYRSRGVEHDYEVHTIAPNWREDATMSAELSAALHTFRDLVEKMR